eukprot:366311-Chlamydomonas_euryale.AAC.10
MVTSDQRTATTGRTQGALMACHGLRCWPGNLLAWEVAGPMTRPASSKIEGPCHQARGAPPPPPRPPLSVSPTPIRSPYLPRPPSLSVSCPSPELAHAHTDACASARGKATSSSACRRGRRSVARTVMPCFATIERMAATAPLTSPVCSRDLMTSVGTRTTDDMMPAAAPPAMGPR